jgi:hypothetical protein
MAAEILVVTPAIRALIRDDKIHQIYSSMQSGKKFGMQTLNDALYQLYVAGGDGGGVPPRLGRPERVPAHDRQDRRRRSRRVRTAGPHEAVAGVPMAGGAGRR